MGWDIKRNKQGLYQIHSTVSGERLHDKKWITEAETKTVMAESAFYRFCEDMIKLDMDFLLGYRVNDKREIKGEHTALRWMIDNHSEIFNKGIELMRKHLNLEVINHDDTK